MEIAFRINSSKAEVFTLVQDYLESLEFNILSKDDNRPWGGFFVFDEEDAEKFTNAFFQGYNVKDLKKEYKLSPKILLVEPGKRLSWQYHQRRAEIWRILQGQVGISISDTDFEPEGKLYKPGDIIQLGNRQRHRLKGLSEWGIVAEIWQHTDQNHPSDEEDIVRLKDDFGRG